MNKKQTIRLNESQLKRVVAESVKRVLTESCWYGDTKPFIDIYKAASEIMEAFQDAASDDYEVWDDCDGRDLDPDIYDWARNVAEQAVSWIQCNSSNMPINGGEDW